MVRLRCCSATVLNYLDRQVLSLTAEKIIPEFHTDNAGFGEMIAAFRFSYAAVQFFGGWIVDALGARLRLSGCRGFVVVRGNADRRAASVCASMWGCRFMLGVGEAFNWPCALKVTESAAGAEGPGARKRDFQQRHGARRDDRAGHRHAVDAAIRMAIGIPCSPASWDFCGSCCGGALTRRPSRAPRWQAEFTSATRRPCLASIGGKAISGCWRLPPWSSTASAIFSPTGFRSI